MGIAFVGTMCSPTSSVGVTEDGGRSLSSVASIAAHEMGHIFNMRHDGKYTVLFYCMGYPYFNFMQMITEFQHVLVLMVTKDASWQPSLAHLPPPGGAVAVSVTSMKGLLTVKLTDVSLTYPLQWWETQSVAMESEREMRSVTVEVHKSAQILVVMLPPAN